MTSKSDLSLVLALIVAMQLMFWAATTDKRDSRVYAPAKCKGNSSMYCTPRNVEVTIYE